MGIGTSILLIAIGAILKYAVNETTVGPLEIQTVGTILLIIGILGLVISALYTFVLSDRPPRRERPVEEPPPPPRDRRF